MKELFEKGHAGGSFSAAAALSVTGHFLVLLLVFMVSRIPISMENDLGRSLIIHATLLSEKEMSSHPQQSVSAVRDTKVKVEVKPKLKVAEEKAVIQSQVVPQVSEHKTISAPLLPLSPQVVEKASGSSSSAKNISIESVGMVSSAGGAGTSRLSGSGDTGVSGTGGTSAVPRYRSNPHPLYPYQARTRGHEGLVVLTAEVREDGRVSSIHLKRSSGYASLDQSALTTVRSWLFEPARRHGMAVPSVVDIPIRFSLQEDYD
ncbi:MAG: energy transducer TonB [Smithellaceae bacterium]